MYNIPVNYDEPFTDPWYYPKECVPCKEREVGEYTPDFTWVGSKWFCSRCKKEVPNE